MLNFAPLSWPHVSVATLVKQVTKAPIKEVKDHKPEIKEHKPEIKEKVEIKEHKPEIKEHKPEIAEQKVIFEGLPFQIGPDPGPAGPAAAAPAEGRHFIAPGERPAVGERTVTEEP